MSAQTQSVFCPVVASEARKMIAAGKFRRIDVSDFPRNVPLYNRHHRLAYFAIEGTTAAFNALISRVMDRINEAESPQERDALLRAMAPA